MASDVTIGGDGVLFVGEDKTIRLELLAVERDADGNLIAPSASSVPVNMTGWVMVFDVRKTDKAADPAILSETPLIIGTYNADRATNTQRATVALTDDDLNLFVGEKTYRHSWKRLTAGSETVVCRGDFSPEKATAP